MANIIGNIMENYHREKRQNIDILCVKCKHLKHNFSYDDIKCMIFPAMENMMRCIKFEAKA